MDKFKEKEEYVVVFKADKKQVEIICRSIKKLNLEILELQRLLNEIPIDTEYKKS